MMIVVKYNQTSQTVQGESVSFNSRQDIVVLSVIMQTTNLFHHLNGASLEKILRKQHKAHL